MSALLNMSGQTFAAETCCTCGMCFYVPADYQQRRQNDHKSFFCPSGHSQSYTGISEADKLRLQLEAERQRATRAEEGRKWAENNARRERIGASIKLGKAKAEKQRLEHRVNCGVCPHCQRTFKQLAAHIKTKHPHVVKR